MKRFTPEQLPNKLTKVKITYKCLIAYCRLTLIAPSIALLRDFLDGRMKQVVFSINTARWERSASQSRSRSRMGANNAEKLHFCFLAAKFNSIYPLPLESIYLFEPVYKITGNEAITLIFIAFILNS